MSKQLGFRKKKLRQNTIHRIIIGQIIASNRYIAIGWERRGWDGNNEM